ncbi:polyprenyl synthetase family protein [Spongiactinospora sp. TRM90649]|uniref:polyprenyl synthetase family protein n=1 Tax=Spongiactinospora sp. TRM90649 TaxID=3031114 RepID=UPI0023FA0E7E|nr:polyprenyl synthetase family protein [Spongiactinospora sp. TRM90649]MDF5752026.1 polyprenyl synthetase family protein [Spongiactinospora sp. TRM90649]
MSLDASPAAPTFVERAQTLVLPALREAVRTLHPWQAEIAGYAFGWAGEGVPAAGGSVAGGGKGLRPALVLVCARGVGVRPEAAVPAAVAVELVHAFSLIHDDIIDGDERRRHRASVWKKYGVGPALLAGDGLLALAMRTLAAAPVSERATRHLSSSLMEIVHGQSDDVLFERRAWTGGEAVTMEEYARMAGSKSGALLACAAALGAALGGAADTVVERLAAMGRQLGIALQIVDDLLGIWGEQEVTGKPVLSDLRRGKKTLPVVAALTSGEAQAGRLAGLLADVPGGGREPEQDSLRAAVRLIEEAGGRRIAERRAVEHVETALGMAARVLDRDAVQELRAYAAYLVGRTR